MCTLIIDWHPGEFVVGANRDENLDRPSEGFAWREDIFCPLDVRGGTWIGINKGGLFVGLTNLDIRDESQPEIKRLTRGAIPIAALLEDNAMDAAEAVEKLLETGLYYPFNLLIADRFNLLSLVHDPYTKASIGLIKPLDEGLHVATSWGIDTWRVPRCCYIKWAWERKDKLENILAYHGDGSADTAICVHDSRESHQTRSSCIIKVGSGCSVEHIDGPACIGRIKPDNGIIINIDEPMPKARVIRNLKWEVEEWLREALR